MRKTLVILLIICLLLPIHHAKAATDTVPPVTQVLINGNLGTNGIYYGSVGIELSAYDTGSGVLKRQYKLSNDGNWMDYTAPFMLTTSQVYNLSYRSIDREGNTETAKQRKITIKLDYAAPVSSVQVQGQLGQNAYYIGPVEVQLSAADHQSGVNYTEYSLDQGMTWNRYEAAINVREPEHSLIYYRSIDNSGNVEKSKKVKANLDVNPPSAPTVVFNPKGWTNSSVSVSILNGTDDQSGIQTTEYRLSETAPWTQYTQPFAVTLPNQQIYARSIDFAGNISEVTVDTVSIDKVNPTEPEIILSDDGWSGEDIIFYLRGGTDFESGIRRLEYKVNQEGTWQEYLGPEFIEDEGLYQVYARAMDWSGNYSSVVQKEAKIDKSPPTPPDKLFNVRSYSNTILLQWSPSSDEKSGVNFYRIYNGDELLGETSDTKILLSNLTLNQQYQFTITATDHSYNESLKSQPLSHFTNELEAAAGRNRNYVMKADGTVWGWGQNSDGQLGDGTTTNRHLPVIVPALRDFIQIEIGVMHNIGLKADGTVWVWEGKDYRGIITPLTQIEGLEDIVAISTGVYHHMALKADGTVWTWGGNYNGELGDGTTNTDRAEPAVVPNLNSVVSISAGYTHSVALKSDGTVWTWGSNSRGALGIDAEFNHIQRSPIKILTLNDVVQIDAGPNYSAALKKDGTVWTWGINDGGQLGDGTTVDRYSPVQVPTINGVTKISASTQVLAMTSEGEVWTWGTGNLGQIGDGTLNQRLTPVKVANLEGMTDIISGDLHNLAVKKNMSIWAWGYNQYGQLGDGTTTNQNARGLVKSIPFPADTEKPAAPVLTSSGIASMSLVLKWNAVKDNVGIKEYLVYQGSTLKGVVTVEGKTADLSTEYTVTQLSPGTTYSFYVIAKDYSDNVSVSSNTLTVTTEAPLPMEVATSMKHTLALKNDGTVWAWGSNSDYQLGIRTISQALVPTQISSLNSIISVSAGNMHSLALKSDGTVYSWGLNMSGQVGHSSSYVINEPKKLEQLSSIIAISAGASHSLALKSDGTVWAWGANYSGELGDGTNNMSYVPKLIPGLSDVIAISAGYNFSTAIKADGTVWTWGRNNNGQLGIGSLTNMNTPVQVNSITNVKQVATGAEFVMALKNDGTVWTWGDNGYGQLGDNTKVDKSIPIHISSLSGIQKVAAGWYHSLAASEQSLWSWGYNYDGQLGNGQTTNTQLPATIASVSNVKSISATYTHNVIVTNNTILAWGANTYGQLGTGNKTASKIPVTVSGFNNPSTLRETSQVAELELNQQSEQLSHEIHEMDVMIERAPDVFEPTVPENVQAIVVHDKIRLSWSASSDNVAVKEYLVYVNNELYTKTTENTGVDIKKFGRMVHIIIKAIDHSGNMSTSSIPIAVN